MRNARPSKQPGDTSTPPLPKVVAASGGQPTPDTMRLLHELHVHEAELAQQNEELRSARDDLEASAQRYFDLYESAPVGLVTLTRRGVVREVNRYGRELLGDGDSDGGDALIDRCLLDRLVDPGRAALAGALATSGPGAVNRSVEIVVCARTTHERVLRAEVRLHPTGGDAVLLALTDITEHRQSEADLAHTREVLELSNRMARIGYWQVDLDTGAATWSAVAREIYDLALADQPRFEQIAGLCTDAEAGERLRVAYTAAVERGEAFDLPIQITSRAGRDRWIRMTGKSDTTGGHARRLYGTVQDIETHVQVEAARVARAAAEMANRSKNAFLARMSHELRTPLNAVLGFSELLQLNASAMSLPGVAAKVGHIRTAGEHLLVMINEVLDLTRIESGDTRITLEVIELAPLLRDCMTLVTPMAAARGVVLRPPACREGQFVVGDRTRVQQVLMNLLSNAVKYSREGGSVQIDSSDDAEQVTITVSDSGHGLSPQQLAQLFQPFNRMGAELRGIEGTGLGLVIAKQLAEAMGGSIEARSVVDVGSTFALRLRRGERDDVNRHPDAPTVKAEGHASDAPPFVVLYVEDNEVNVLLMRAALALRPQVRLEVAVDGQTGLDMARRLRPDLVLLDMSLPIMGGAAVLDHLRADPDLARIPCVAVSANALTTDIQAALDAGFDDYIVKPFALHHLLSLVDSTMADTRTRATQLG